MKKKTILLCTDVKFWRLRMGNHRRIHTMILFFLRCGFQVKVVGIYELNYLDRKQIKSYGNKLEVIEIRKYKTPKMKGRILYKYMELCIKAINDIKKRTGLVPNNKLLRDYFSYKCLLIFQCLCKLEKPQIILVEYIYFGYLVNMSRKYIPKRCQLIIDTHDVMYQRCESFQTHNQKNFFHITKKQEKKVLNYFNIIIAINRKDYKSFKKLLRKKTVITVPHPHEIKKLALESQETVSIMYIAGVSDATVHTIEQFIKYVWLDLSKRYKSDIQLNIYGQVCTKISKQYAKFGINLVGFIENLEQAYKENHIVINPVLFGSGLKIKNVEALCYGKPLVTTSIGAQGIEEGANKAFFVCDKYEDMYNCICKLIDSTKTRDILSEQAYQFALKEFTEDKAYKQLNELINKECNSREV